MSYKIELDVDACIGAGSCEAALPSQWKVNKEGKAELKEEEIEEKDLDKQMKAARSCPTNAIHIINKETGEKLI